MGSLQLRLFLTYLVIITVTLSLTAFSLFLQIGGYRDSITYSDLQDLGRVLDSTANVELQNQQANVTAAAVQTNSPGQAQLSLKTLLTEQGQAGVTADTSIVILNKAGAVIPSLVASSLPIARAIVKPVGSGAVAGAASVVARTPHRCRMEVPGGTSLLCVEVPLTQGLRAALGGGAASMVVAKPGAGLGQVVADLGPRLVFSGLIGLAAALVLGFLLSRSVAAPLRNMARAAHNVARGNYRQRVPATGPSEVRELASSFNRMTEDVQRSQQTLRDFLANISHELKTPLTSIRGFSQAMLDGTIEDHQGVERSAKVINDESSRVLRLVQELLDLSRIESGQISMHQDNFPLRELLEHVQEVFALRSEESGVSLEVSPVPEARIRGDFDRLEQVFDNLLDNAFRHTPRGGSVRIASRDLQPGTIQVTVSDTGAGIAQEDVPHLFERFYRANGSRSAKGHGLGLAISREIVRAHGGEIWATSEERRGTTFVFTLPTAGREGSIAGAQ